MNSSIIATDKTVRRGIAIRQPVPMDSEILLKKTFYALLVIHLMVGAGAFYIANMTQNALMLG